MKRRRLLGKQPPAAERPEALIHAVALPAEAAAVAEPPQALLDAAALPEEVESSLHELEEPDVECVLGEDVRQRSCAPHLFYTSEPLRDERMPTFDTPPKESPAVLEISLIQMFPAIQMSL